MNDIATLEPTASARDVGTDDPLIAARLQIPISPSTEFVLSPSSRYTTRVVERLLGQAIQVECGLVLSHRSAFTFGRSYYEFTLGGPFVQPALMTLKSELDSLQLLDLAQLAWWDRNEQVFRLAWPTTAAVFAAPTEAEAEADLRLIEQAERELRGWLRDGGKPSA